MASHPTNTYRARKMGMGMMVLIVSCSLSFTQCKKRSINSLKSVNIPQTPVKRQYGVGFCWSYAISGLLESLALSEAGEQIDLSEEYLGFYHMIEQLEKFIASEKRVADLNISEGKSTFRVLALIDRIGLVPESVFSIKFKDNNTNLEEAVENAFKVFFASQDNLQRLRTDGVSPDSRHELARLLWQVFQEKTGGKVIGSPLLDSFTYNQKTYSPQSFKTTFTHPVLDDYYERVWVNSPQDFQRLKKALLMGFPVPFRFYRRFPDETSAHAVLAVDYVSENGKFGPMQSEELSVTFNEPLAYLVAKESQNVITSFYRDSREYKKRGYIKLDFLTQLKPQMDAQEILYYIVPTHVDGQSLEELLTPQNKFIRYSPYGKLQKNWPLILHKVTWGLRGISIIYSKREAACADFVVDGTISYRGEAFCPAGENIKILLTDRHFRSPLRPGQVMKLRFRDQEVESNALSYTYSQTQ